MATLEKIRSQQKLLFTIVIVALFLFIISISTPDAVGRFLGFGHGTDIAKVGGEKISYEDYRQRVELLNKQQQQTDHEVQQQNVIQSLIVEKLVKDQIDKLGINVTDAEIGRAMTGAVPHPAASQFIQYASRYLQLPNADGATLYSAITNPGRFNLRQEQLDYVAQNVFGAATMAEAWAMQERNVEETIQQQALNSLLSGLFVANELDAKSIYADNTTTANVSYVTTPLSAIADDAIEVTDADLQAKWNETKSRYKLSEETRLIDYIIVPIDPSKADYDAAEVEVDRLVESLRANPGLDGAVNAAGFVNDNKTVKLSEIKKDPALAIIPDSLVKKEGVYKYRRQGNTFRVAKVTDVKGQVDSLNVSMYIAESVAQADSVLKLVESGKSFKELAEENAGNAADSIWQSLVGVPADFASIFENATVGQAFVHNDSVQGSSAVYKVNSRKAPKDYAEVTVYSLVVDPSSTTVSDIKTQLSSFLASNSKGDAFSEHADSLYQLRHATVTAATPKLGYNPNAPAMGFADTRHAIKWAMDAKKGEVSPIFEDNRDFYVVAALKDVYTSDYIPYNSSLIKDGIEAMAKADKKAAKLIEQYNGKASDLAGYAKLMGAEVITDSMVVFSSPRLGSLPGAEYALQGKIAAAKKGQLVGPAQGANEVVVFVVNDTNASARPYSFVTDGQAFQSAFGIKDYIGLFTGNRKIENMSLDFENFDK